MKKDPWENTKSDTLDSSRVLMHNDICNITQAKIDDHYQYIKEKTWAKDNNEKLRIRRTISYAILWFFFLESFLLLILIGIFFICNFVILHKSPEHAEIIISVTVGGTLAHIGFVLSRLAKFAYRDVDYCEKQSPNPPSFSPE